MRAPLHARSPPDALSGGQATPQSPSLDPGSPCTCCPAASITIAWIPSLQGLSGFPTTPEFKVLGLPTPPHSAPAAAHRLTPHSQLSLCVCTLPACEGLGPALHSCWAPATLIWGSHVPSPCGAFIPAAPSAWISSYNCRRWETGRPISSFRFCSNRHHLRDTLSDYLLSGAPASCPSHALTITLIYFRGFSKNLPNSQSLFDFLPSLSTSH